MRKLNVGAGTAWFKQGWEVLDNAPGDYRPAHKHKGKCWDSGLPNETFDIIVTYHMLEHVPHTRIERTIAEFNRIMKPGGTLRIEVPDLRKAAIAYVNGDDGYFDQHGESDKKHLGIGSMFVHTVITPGQQALLVSREMDEVFSGYAHLFCYDFEMMRTLLEKWGFGEVVESTYRGSAIEELRAPQELVCGEDAHAWDSPYVRANEYQKSGKPWHYTGFDKQEKKGLFVEARKVRDEPYALDREFAYNRRARFDSPPDRLKLAGLRIWSTCVDALVAIARALGVGHLRRALRGR